MMERQDNDSDVMTAYVVTADVASPRQSARRVDGRRVRLQSAPRRRRRAVVDLKQHLSGDDCNIEYNRTLY